MNENFKNLPIDDNINIYRTIAILPVTLGGIVAFSLKNKTKKLVCITMFIIMAFIWYAKFF